MSGHSTCGLREKAQVPIVFEMKRTIALLGVLMTLAPAASASDAEREQRALENVQVSIAPGHTAVIKERFESTLYYRVCVHRKAKPRKRSCRDRQTNARGRDSVSLAGFVAKQGAGRYVVVWTGGGLKLGKKGFKA
jgi:hypothetical protein